MPKTSQRKKRTSARRGGASMRGRGGYFQDLWNNGKKLIPRAVGGALGTLVGRPQAGWDLGGDFSKKVLGWGDYSAPWNVTMNSLVSRGQSPTVANVSDAGIRLSHREYVGTVYSSTTFRNDVYYVNPGLPSTFPWLAKLASNFQQYELMGCLITFKSALTNAVATFSSLGSVIIAADMNAASPPASSQMQLEQMQFVASAKPSESIVAPVECAPRLGGAGVRYIRNGAVPSSASILDYDHCMIQVAVSGQPTTGVELGRLYLSYDVKLLNPKMVSGAGSVASYNYTPVAAYAFGVAGTTRNYDTIGVNFPITDGVGYTSFVIPPGSGSEVYVSIDVKASGSITSGVPTHYFTNMKSSTRSFPNGTWTLESPQSGAETYVYGVSFYYHIIDPTVPAVVRYSGMPFSSNNVSGQIRFAMLPNVEAPASAPGINFRLGTVEASDASDEQSECESAADIHVEQGWMVPVSVAASAAAGPPRNTPGRRS